MNIKIICLFSFIIFGYLNNNAQVKGIIKDADGQTLAYATVYIEGTSIGTISNADGEYVLDILEKGPYTVTFQYVGYKKTVFSFEYTGKVIHKNIILSPDENIMQELIISADREDPAYEIIRKAIKKREYFKKQVKSLEADLYVKGVVKVLDAPKEILGEKIGDMNGILDSMRQGIVYLSESQSKFYYQEPDKTKEVMISTVKSGDNSLFTANQFSWASFDLYNEYLKFGRSIVSPIADNALSHYNYKLENASVDKDGQVINKIQLIPKSNNAPLLHGYIYIVENSWNIYSTDLKLYGTALKNTFIDTINVKQVYIPVAKPDTWRLFSQVFSFNAGLMGFKMGGSFSYFFSDFKVNKDVTSHFASNETFRIEKSALKVDSAFWKAERPIPLTLEEEKDYIKKDSLQRLWNSKSYMDSLDRVNNKFKLLNLFMGYTWDNSFKKTSVKIPSPLSSLRFNAVEGFKISLNAIWSKSDTLYRKWSVEPNFDYGFSDKTVKPNIKAEYRFDNYSQGKVYLSGGRKFQQFEPREPITERNNTWTSLWNKTNNIKLYQNEFATIGYAQEISNGIYIDLKTAYTSRKPLFVNTQYSLRKKDLLYPENIPRVDIDQSYYDANKYWKNVVNILLRPAQKYSSYPNTKIRATSDWPNIMLEYESATPLMDLGSHFHKLTVRVRDQYVNARLLGYFKYNIEGGKYLGGQPSFFGDFFHPMGNEIDIPIDLDLSSFNLLPYYEFSTNKHYIQVNFRHHFNGYIFDKIPLINKTPLKMVIGSSALYVADKGHYIEPFIGIENFRIGPIHLFDIDYSFAFDKNGFRDHGIIFRLSQMMNL